MSIQVKITGHLAADPQVQFTSNGKTVAHFTVMTTARRKDDETGDWVDGLTTAIRVTAWENLADNVSETLAKGHKVTVTGKRLTADAYVSNDGEAKATLELTADEVDLSLRKHTAAIQAR